MSEILLPIIIVAGIGFVAGLILAIASIVMAVPVNKKMEAILEILPGVNCGACGFSGCEGYAKALANNEAKVGLCSPGGDKVSKEISKLLGIESEKIEGKKAVVMCFGTHENTENKMKYQGIGSCSAAAQLYSGIGSCQYGCIGFGDCKNVCPYGAIDIYDGVASVSFEKCVGCGKCVATCPKNIIKLIPDKEQAVVHCSNKNKGIETKKVCKVGCIGCMRCVKECPAGAITVQDFVAKVDPEKCAGCKKCVEVCPSKCIKLLPLS
ncbi:MAG: H+/Na+-translocating ferredoxin:NAD+ oxidoreductase subunit B [Eubacteriales bacterium SKADARSKE-1]|nr:H+/Na+-translocating ferredoxin:NAD+ oxidoreductase subunit B [Eubacteriales bacterium SKADARSKE-1]